jgi:hypothetical protein
MQGILLGSNFMTKSSKHLEPLTDEREIEQDFTATLYISRINRDHPKKVLEDDLLRGSLNTQEVLQNSFTHLQHGGLRQLNSANMQA